MLKKIIFAGLLSIATFAGAADKWVLVQESSEGMRLIVNSETFTPINGDDGNRYIAAFFKYIGEDGREGKQFVYMTNPATCSAGGGKLFWRVEQSNGDFLTKGTYFWSREGTKMYDAGGGALCDILQVRLEEMKNSDATPQRKGNRKEKSL